MDTYNSQANVAEYVSSLDKRLGELQQIFDAAWEVNKTVTPKDSLSRLCTTLIPNSLQDFGTAVDLIKSQAAEIERLKAQLALSGDAYMDGVKKAIYEIMKESDIPGSDEICNSGDSDDGMCRQVAMRINGILEKARQTR